MRQILFFVGSAASLSSLCTVSNFQASLPSNITGLTLSESSLTANAVYNASSQGGTFFPSATFDYCNVTFTYSHNGRGDSVALWHWLPAPAAFQKRYLATGGGGFAISSGEMSLPGGVIYGAAVGTTDGGFGSFRTSSDAVFLLANGTINWQSLYMFGYEAIHELSVIGKAFTREVYVMANDTKLYSYYQGCSEGGRGGWSQVQRYGDEWDGAVIGAPALRFSFQQVQHLYSNTVEKTLDYYPPPCELEKIVNETIKTCDPLDGLTDGVIARSDLCRLHFNLSSLVGMSYSCAANSGGSGMGSGPPSGMAGSGAGASAGGSAGSSRGSMPTASATGSAMTANSSQASSTSPPTMPGSSGSGGPGGPGSGSSSPAQNGSVTAKGVAVAQAILHGLHDTSGNRVYLSYQPGASFTDAQTAYNSSTESWQLSINQMGGEFIQRYLNLQNSSDLNSLSGVTYDTLRDWMIQGWQRYQDFLETTWPDLTPFHTQGGKVLHFHGEADSSIPTASSVRYWNSVRSIMYPGKSFNDSTSALGEWYRLFLIPGAGHCAPNSAMPNGPFPTTTLEFLTKWVENGTLPTTLEGTITQGSNEGQKQQICAFPLRPRWHNSFTLNCEYDEASIQTWIYDLDGVKMPVY